MRKPIMAFLKTSRPATTMIFLVAALSLGLAWGQYRDREQVRAQAPDRRVMMGGLFERTVNLNDLWFLQSSEKIKTGGEQISQSGFKIEGWYPAVVPSTVMGTLVQNNLYPDIFV